MLFRWSAMVCCGFIMWLGTSMALAAHCPSVNELKEFQPVLTWPYAYNSKNQNVEYVSFAAKEQIGDTYVVWLLYLNPVRAKQNEDIYANIQSTLSQLKLVSLTAFEHHVSDFDNGELNFQFCAYTLPNNTRMQAMAYRFEDLDDRDETTLEVSGLSQMNMKLKLKHHPKIQRFMQQLMLQSKP
ncbi:MAG: hypothetical protein NTW08_01685 [Gammaproteobacteria bacterium]|nr:hypothetical protein [Gammaproteobacteria bacterium]